VLLKISILALVCEFAQEYDVFPSEVVVEHPSKSQSPYLEVISNLKDVVE
jgi:hypothetical protein